MMLTRSLLAVAAMDAWAEPSERGARDAAGVIALPAPRASGSPPLEQSLAQRRSVRTFTAQPLSLADVAQLLWAAQGITASGGRRTAPSAGALYPLELHVVATRVSGLSQGSYRYDVSAHALHATQTRPLNNALTHAAHDQQPLRDAAAVVVIAAVHARTAAKYGSRANRYVAFEAGAASENLALQAAALGLGSVVVGAFDDDAVARALGLGPGERPLAIMPIGKVN